MNIVHLIQISIGAILINNIVLSRFLGLCPFFGVSRKLSTSIGMGMAVTFVMTLASFITWPIQEFILIPTRTTYLQTIIFILVIGAFVQCVELVVIKYSPLLYEALGIYLPLITTNCALLAVVIINTQENGFTGQNYTFIESIINGFSSGIGFTLALILMAGVREKLEVVHIPKPFEGLPISFIAAGLMALAFFGFRGFTVF
jgi:electron transport complex protein RnfA